MEEDFSKINLPKCELVFPCQRFITQCENVGRRQQTRLENNGIFVIPSYLTLNNNVASDIVISSVENVQLWIQNSAKNLMAEAT